MTGVDWQPSAEIETLRQRALLIARVRAFFSERHYLEVETPIMGHYGITDPYLDNIKAEFRSNNHWLQTSPEYPMKRLLAAGSGPIFQLARVFRDDELGRWHNPEFTLLEWYQLNVDHHQLMDEMNVFLQCLLNSAPMSRKTYQQAFAEACDIDPLYASINDFKRLLFHYELDKVLNADETDRDQYLFLLMSHVVEPYLAKQEAPVAIYHFPPTQAALAQVNNGVAERFEVYYQGIELANGFHELQDPKAQAKRFDCDRLIRARLGRTALDPDPRFLAALENGLPSCSGVALGIDRLLALALNKTAISEVIAFDYQRA